MAALHKASEPTSGRQARQLAAIAEATTDIQHVSGKDNVVVDALSCIGPAAQCEVPGLPNPPTNDEVDEDILEVPGFVCNAIAPGIDYRELAAAQTADPDVQPY